MVDTVAPPSLVTAVSVAPVAAVAHPQTRTDEPGPAETASRAAAGNSGLFGRSLLYVIVGSLQLLVTSLVSPALAYLLAPDQFGQISLALAVYQVLYILAVFGFDQLIVIYDSGRAGGAHLALRLLATAICTAFVLCAGFAVSEPFWRSLVGADGSSTVLLAAVLWVGPSASNAFVLALLRGRDRFSAFITVSLLTAIGGQVFGLGVLLIATRDPAAYAWTGVVTQMIAFIVGVRLVRPQFGRLLGASAFGTALKQSAPIAVSAMSIYILSTSDRILISNRLGTTSVAQYQVAYTVGSAILILLSFLHGAWLPRLLRINDEAELARVSRRSRDLLLLVLVPTVAAIVLAMPLLLRLVAPASYGGDSLLSVAAVVAIAAFPVAHAGASSRLLIVQGRRVTVAVATGLAGIANIGLNLALIPAHGILGSAVATLVAFSAQALLLSYLLDRLRTGFTPATVLLLAVGGGVSVAAYEVARADGLFWVKNGGAVGLGIVGLALLLRARNAVDAVEKSRRPRGAGAHAR